MQIEEQSPQYTSFLRSGAYPVISRKLVQYSDLLARAGGLAALAIIAGGAGYTMTQWFVPLRGSHAAAAAADAPSQDIEPALQHVGEPVTSDAASAVPSAHDVQPAHAQDSSNTLTPSYARPSTILARTVVDHGLGPRRRHSRTSESVETPAGGVTAGDPGSNLAAPSAELDLVSTDSMRTQMLAERVRSWDELHEAAAVNPAANGGHASEDTALPEVNPPAAPAPVPAPAPVAAQPAVAAKTTSVPNNPPPRVPVMQLKAAANIEDLTVRGSLSASNVRRSVERLRPAYAACYEQAAQQAGHNRFGRVQLSLTIDEAGRARTPRVQGAELPGLGACLNTVTSKLVSAAPDTGTVRASIVVNFVP
jgi:hypothetical protein